MAMDFHPMCYPLASTALQYVVLEVSCMANEDF